MFQETIVQAADKRKALSILAMRVSQLTEVTSFIVIVEGRSVPQIQALSLSIEVCIVTSIYIRYITFLSIRSYYYSIISKEDTFTELKSVPKKEGKASSGWIVLDYGNSCLCRTLYHIEYYLHQVRMIQPHHYVE